MTGQIWLVIFIASRETVMFTSQHISVFYAGADLYPLGDRFAWSSHLVEVDPWGVSQFP